MTTLAKYLTLLTVAVLSVSCSSHDIDTTVTPQPGLSACGCMAGFTITLDSGGGDIRSRLASRAPSEGDYEAGTYAENYIDIDGKDFMILFFDKEDRYIGALDNVLVIIESSDGSMKRYRVSGTVPVSVVDDAGQEFKMMMLANWRHDYPQPEKGSALQDIASSTLAAYTFDSQLLDHRIGRRFHLLFIYLLKKPKGPEKPVFNLHGQKADIHLDAFLQQKTDSLSVLRHKSDSLFKDCQRLFKGQLLPLVVHLAGGRIQSRDAVGNGQLSLSCQAAEA